MDRNPRNGPTFRTVAGLEEARDLRAQISKVLDAAPVDERLLRDAVWNFVGAERDSGVSPGRVIPAVTALVEESPNVPASDRQSVLRSVILWSVEAYFGHLGGDVFGRGTSAAAAEPVAPAPQ